MALAISAPASISPIRRMPAAARSPHEILVTSIVDGSAADLGWLAWQDSLDPVVVPCGASSPLDPVEINEFPDPPQPPVRIERDGGSGSWSVWCRVRGIRSCIIVPVLGRSQIVGSMGLASVAADALDDEDLRRLQVVASLAVHARRYE